MEENVRKQMSLTRRCVNSTIDFIDESLTLSTFIKANLSDHMHTYTNMNSVNNIFFRKMCNYILKWTEINSCTFVNIQCFCLALINQALSLTLNTSLFSISKDYLWFLEFLQVKGEAERSVIRLLFSGTNFHYLSVTNFF